MNNLQIGLSELTAESVDSGRVSCGTSRRSEFRLKILFISTIYLDLYQFPILVLGLSLKPRRTE